MSLLDIQNGMNKIEIAIAVIQQNIPHDVPFLPYYVCDSGGADSGIVVDLVKRAGVRADFHYNVSPIDPPEIYAFLKKERPETKWEYFARGFWKENRGLPTRRFRWCCALIKEAGGSNMAEWVPTKFPEKAVLLGGGQFANQFIIVNVLSVKESEHPMRGHEGEKIPQATVEERRYNGVEIFEPYLMSYHLYPLADEYKDVPLDTYLSNFQNEAVGKYTNYVMKGGKK
jgi:hypothetical protein